MSGFLSQPSAKYRNFQIVFTILTLNFALPTLTYVFSPAVAQEQFASLNALLGGAPYTFAEAQSHFWRYLGAANVATLALMCALLQWDLRGNFAVLKPLTFMKALAATLWLVGYIQHPEYPAFGAAALLDFASSAAFVYFATRARSDIEGLADDELVPRPQPLRAMSRAASNVALDAVLPTDEPLEPLVRSDLQARGARRLSLGFGASSWVLVLAPLASRLRRPMWRLSRDERDRFVASWASSDIWLLRQVVEVVKMVAAFAVARR